MTAWAALVANSTIQTGSAWQHLMAQGGGSSVTYQIFGELEVFMDNPAIEVEVEEPLILISVDTDVLNVKMQEVELEVSLDGSNIEN